MYHWDWDLRFAIRIAVWVGMDIVAFAPAFEDGRREAFS